MLSASLLGDLSLRCDGAPIQDVDTPRLQSLLAYLIIHRDAPRSRTYLAYLFWPDTTEAQARMNLRNLLHHLRRSLPDADAYEDLSTQSPQWLSSAPFTLSDSCQP